jgi:hypothetical protein
MQTNQTIHIACAQCGATPTPICKCGRVEAGWVLAEQAVIAWTPAVEGPAKTTAEGGG